MKTLLKIIVAAIVAVGMAVGAEVLICEVWHLGYWAAPMVVFVTFGVVGMYAGEWIAERLLQAILRRRQEREDIIKFRRSMNYGQAAVFIGTACMFIGTPDECDNVCQDMWHWGQQAEVRQLSGEETSFDII